ncbi:unnamed protein product [Durusdinium trenchii]|uniref:Uncharacterized protein n=1 Tax=Durusdinium trenchii TaxID=1381693 RepID=A0ABP0PWY6_9DINO
MRTPSAISGRKQTYNDKGLGHLSSHVGSSRRARDGEVRLIQPAAKSIVYLHATRPCQTPCQDWKISEAVHRGNRPKHSILAAAIPKDAGTPTAQRIEHRAAAIRWSTQGLGEQQRSWATSTLPGIIMGERG